jgi:hypothetical protein
MGEESSMQPRTCKLTAFTLVTAMALGGAVMAADLPKEASFSGTHYGSGTIKATPRGKERLLSVFEGSGVWITNGFLDHATTRCFGMGDYTNGIGRNHGYCIETLRTASDGTFGIDAVFQASYKLP